MMMSLRRRARKALGVGVAAGSILVAGASPAQATTVLRMTFSEVVDGAEVIAVGTVSAIEETWDAEREMPFTYVTFSDVEVLKGEAGGRELTLRFLGGPAPNGLTLAVAGMPRFAVGQQAVVFSIGNGVQACPLVGWWQGLYRVVRDAGRNVLTIADHAGRPVAGFDGVAGQRVTRLSPASPATAADAVTLDAFRAMVESEL